MKKLNKLLLIVGMIVSSFSSAGITTIAEDTILKQEKDIVINIEQKLINDSHLVQVDVTVECDSDTLIKKIEVEENEESVESDYASFEITKNGIYTILVDYEKLGELNTETRLIEINGIVEIEDNDYLMNEEKNNEPSLDNAKEDVSIEALSTIVITGTVGTVDWTLDDTGVLVFGGGVFPNDFNWQTWGLPLRGSVIKVVFDEPIIAGNTLKLMFSDYSSLTIIEGMNKVDTTNVVDMGGMFSGARSLITVDVSTWDTSNVTTMGSMFSNTVALTTVDVSTWDTSNVTTMSSMFSRASALITVDASSWDTSSVTNMSGMFSSASALTTVDASSWDTSSVTNMSSMFYNASALTTVDVSSWDTSSVTTMMYMFRNASSLVSLDTSKWNISSVTSMYGMFMDASSLNSLNVSNWDVSKVASMELMFMNASSLNSLDVLNWNTSNVTNMRGMFEGAQFLEKIDASNWDVSKVTSMSRMFLNAKSLKDLNISTWDVSKERVVTFMFSGINCPLDLSGWNTMNWKNGTTSGSNLLTSWGGKELTIGDNFKFVSLISASPINQIYTGKWQFVGTGSIEYPNGKSYTVTELINEVNAKVVYTPGTYVWEKALYTLNYDGNGGAGIMSSTTHFYGENVIIPTNEFVAPAGTVFLGWSLTAQKVVEMNDIKPNLVLSHVIRQNTSMFAVWAADANGNGIPDVDEIFLEISLTTSSVNGTITNWVLKGDVNRDGIVNKDDLEIIENHVSRIDVITDSTMLLAMDLNNDGRINSSDANILSMLFDGTTRIPNNTFNFALTNTPTAGYETSGVTINGVYYVVPAKGNSITVDGYTMTVDTNGIATVEGIVQDYLNEIIFNNMPLNSITLTYHQNNGKPNVNITITVGGMIGGFTPIKEGHTFEGWYFTPDFQGGTDFDHSYRPATNVDLYAKWSPIVYQVRFEDWDGNMIEEVVYDFGATILVPTSPSRDGYIFAGWTPEVETTMPARDVVYVATYTMIPIVTPTPSTPAPSTPIPEAGRTCQDDGYPNDYYWNGTACVIDAVTPPVVNQNPPTNQNKPNQSIEEPEIEEEKIITPVIDTVIETPEADDKIEVVTPEETPLVKGGGWSLINLIIMISSMTLAIHLLIMKKRKEELEDDIILCYQKNKSFIILGTLCTVLLIVVFFLTQNLSSPMILVDKYTWIMIVILIINLPIYLFAIQWREVKN